MPKIRPGMKRPPLGFDVVNDALDAFELDMRSVMHTAPLARGKPVMVHGERGAKRSRVSNEELKAPELGAPHLDEDAAQQRSPSGGDSAPMVETDGCAGGDGAGGPVGAAPAEHVGGEWDDIEACPAVAPAEVIAGHAANPFAAVVERVPPLWMVAHINRERTRYVYDMHYKSKQISKEVLDYCCEMNFIDAGLVRRWRVPGYEKLCCVNCAAPGVASTLTSSSSSRAVHARKQQRHEEHQHRPGRGGLESATCICRVPLAQRRQGLVACLVCGCSGCCSGDRAEGPTPTPPARERSLGD